MRPTSRMLPAALAAGSMLLSIIPFTVSVSAAHADEIARMEISPAKGTLDTPIHLRLGVTCPKGAPNALVVLTGPGIAPAGENLVGNSELTAFEVDASGTMVIPVIYPLAQVQQGLPAGTVLDGDYRITMICRRPLDATSLGEFNAYLRIDAKRQTYRELLAGADVAPPAAPTMLPQKAEPDSSALDPAGGDSAAAGDGGVQQPTAVTGSGTTPEESSADAGPDGSSGGDPAAEAAVTTLAEGDTTAAAGAATSGGSGFPMSYLFILVGAMLVGGGITALLRRRSS